MDTTEAAVASAGACTATAATTTTQRAMTMTIRERTQAIAVAEVRYGIEYASLNERFWLHIDTTLNLVQTVAGALALAGLLGSGSAITAVAGAVMALVSGLQLSWTPLQRSINFRDARHGFHGLAKRAWSMTLADLDAAIEDLRRDAPPGARVLAKPALNAVEAQLGADAPPMPLSMAERAALWLA